MCHVMANDVVIWRQLFASNWVVLEKDCSWQKLFIRERAPESSHHGTKKVCVFHSPPDQFIQRAFWRLKVNLPRHLLIFSRA